MTKFINWLASKQVALLWFVIGWFSNSCLEELIKGNYGLSALFAFIVATNYYLYK